MDEDGTRGSGDGGVSGRESGEGGDDDGGDGCLNALRAAVHDLNLKNLGAQPKKTTTESTPATGSPETNAVITGAVTTSIPAIVLDTAPAQEVDRFGSVSSLTSQLSMGLAPPSVAPTPGITPSPTMRPETGENRNAPAENRHKQQLGSLNPTSAANPPDPAEDLKKAILNGKTSQLHRILSAHPHLANTKIGTHSGTAVHYVIRNGNGEKGTETERLEMLQAVAEAPCVFIDWDATDLAERTPLHLACAHNRKYLDIITFLLKHGADPNLLDNTQCTPLHDAVTEGHQNLVDVLLSNPRTEVNTPGNNSRTALHKAAYRGHLYIAGMLLRSGPDMVDQRDADGFTPLHDASRQNKPDMVERLIEAEADVNAKAKAGVTPLHLAASSNALAAAEVLLRADAYAVFNHAKETPLMVAQRKGHTAMVDLLRNPLDAGTNLLATSGKRLQVSQPTEDQKAVSKRFNGFVWPSINGNSKHDKATVFDLLYAEEPKLKQSRKNKSTRWIHLPTNNVRM